MRYQLSVMILSVGILLTIAGCGSNSFKDPGTNLTSPGLGNGGTGTSGSATSGGSGSGTSSGNSSGGGTTGSGTTGAGTSGSGTGSATGGSGSGGSGGTTSGSSAPVTVQVTVSSPGDGSTVASPVHLVASATGSVVAMHVYVDNGDAFQTRSAQLDTALNIPSGPHAILVQAWDQNGNVYKSAPVNVTVSGPPVPTPNVAQIQRMSGWDSCSVCAGKWGDGPGTSHDIAIGINSPSISGSSAKFWVGGTPWGAALWWRNLGGQDDVANFRYDLDFYTESLGAAQALEFDMNQNVGGKRYIFGTECDFRNTGTWRVWNGSAAQWVSTGIGCSAPSTWEWHHLTWVFARSDGQVHFVAVALDGDWHDVDRSFGAIGGGGSGLDVAFQTDLNGTGGDVTVWLDNVNVAWW